ncbi:MAG: glycoside hydrolase family 97 protein [Mucilaginibacter sp.]|nr:glycoside hydrolase family 97 protein [Mucilaginibacter sp.]
MKTAVITFAVVLLTNAAVRAQNYRVNSPDNALQITVSNKDQLQYSVNSNGKSIINPSALGFEFMGEEPMGKTMKVVNQSAHEFNQTWQPVVKSKHSRITDHYNELELLLEESGGRHRKMKMFFRAYNDGVAFRYQLFGNVNKDERQITKELTSFNIAGNAKAWVAEYGRYNSSQESEFWPRNINYVTNKTIAALPFLIETAGKKYVAITEADIDNYPGFYIGSLSSDTTASDHTTLVTKLAPLPGEKESGIKAKFTDNLFTPWRVIMLADRPGKLIESEIIQNLNPPCALSDVSWIKPGMSAWDNWWSGDVKMDMPTIKKYIDLASAQHWPYMLIDWQWYGQFNSPEADITKPAPQINMPEILAYAKSKNVKCWIWLYNSDVDRNSAFEKAFPIYQQWGIAGVKIDFMDRDDQQMVNWYRRIITTAAKCHLMVDFHGAFKPDGIIRTYPNMITREGVMGEEYSKFSNRVTPEHNTTLPFTRMLAGQMDYTPGGFLNVTKANFRQEIPTVVMNTRCAELSKFVIYESPFTVYCDAPENILGQPGADFLKGMPTIWDDTKVLAGYPGEYIAIAKQSGKNWYVGVMNNSIARSLSLDLKFLPAGKYSITTWADAPDADVDPKKLVKTTGIINSQKALTIKMVSGGGFVAQITPINSK